MEIALPIRSLTPAAAAAAAAAANEDEEEDTEPDAKIYLTGCTVKKDPHSARVEAPPPLTSAASTSTSAASASGHASVPRPEQQAGLQHGTNITNVVARRRDATAGVVAATGQAALTNIDSRRNDASSAFPFIEESLTTATAAWAHALKAS